MADAPGHQDNDLEHQLERSANLVFHQKNQVMKRLSELSATPEEQANLNAKVVQWRVKTRDQWMGLADLMIDSQNHSSDLIKAQNEMAVTLRSANRARFQAVRVALGFSEKITMLQRCADAKVGLARLMFLVTLAGCEFDLLGFCMSFSEYWFLDGSMQTMLRVLLVVQPFVYVMIASAYTLVSRRLRSGKSGDIKTDAQAPQRGQTGDTDTGKAMMLEWAHKVPVNFFPYHWMPFVRFYLVLKPVNDNDIEGVFMANSLSSFTLGSVQMLGIISSFLMLKAEDADARFSDLPFTVQMNFVTWLVNWTITVLYFLTPIAQKMKNTAAVEAVTYNSNNEYRHGVCEHRNAVLQDRQDSEQRHVSKFKDMLIKELYGWTECDVEDREHAQDLLKICDLKQFTVMDLLDLKKDLHRQLASRLGKV